MKKGIIWGSIVFVLSLIIVTVLPAVLLTTFKPNQDEKMYIKPNKEIKININNTSYTLNENDPLEINPSISFNDLTINEQNTVVYQWQESSDGTNWTDIINQTNKNLNIKNISSTYNNQQIRLKATFNNESYYSNVITLIIKPSSNPNIIIDFKQTSYTLNDQDPLHVVSDVKTQDIANPNLITYVWQKSSDGVTWNDLTTQTKKDLDIVVSTSDNNTKYRLKATYNNKDFYSQNIITITVNALGPTPVASNSPEAKIKVSIGSNNLEIVSGSNFSLLPKISASDKSYLDNNHSKWSIQWLLNNQVIINSSNHNNEWIINENREHSEVTFFNFMTNNATIKCRILLNNQNNNYIESNTILVTVKDNLNPDPKPLNPNQQEFVDDSYTSIGSYYEKVVDNNVPRPQIVDTYLTDLWNTYHNDYNFVYPGWNRNYEKGKNYEFTNINNPNQVIDAYPLVFNEVIGNNINSQFANDKFNNALWIKDEINKNTFKKHPAADTFYEQDISNLHAVKKDFVFSTATKGPATLGLYVPAGEVVTITFDEETFKLMQQRKWSGIKFVINQNFWDNRAQGDTGQISNRYPFIRSSFNFNDHIDPATRTMKIGSPFGGGLSLRIDSPLYLYSDKTINPSCATLKFSISGAVECMQYIDGYTSEAEWNNQVELAKNQLLAPVLQAKSTYFALTIPFTGISEVGHRKLSSLIYPKELFQKWNDFLFLSNYGAGRDIDHNLNRIDMEFCDDIWGGAGAWGGGDTLYCSTDWGVKSFFYGNPIELFSPGNNWGLFHEINHNFEQNAAFFNKRGHGETNQATMFNFSVIGDVGRYRNELNWNGEGLFAQHKVGKSLGWTYLDNPFVNIANTLNKSASDEYPIYALLLYFMGSKNYVDYVRYDVRNKPSGANGWSGLKEIEDISNCFKLNFWPAMQKVGKWWNDNWPADYNSATNEQKAIIDNLATKYPAIDFVANLYACGNYIYDSINNTYIYGGDTNTPYEIIANQNKVFNLKDFIISMDENFAWDDLEFNPTTALGATLSFNKNTKELTYVPAPNTCNKTDEFDITIKPSNFLNKPSYYVPGYKFKIKVRLIANCGTVETYQIPKNTVANDTFIDLNKATKISEVPFTRNGEYIFDKQIEKTDTMWDARKINFKFIAPETGTYKIRAKYDDYYRLLINGNEVFKSTYYSPNFKDIYTINLNKGDEVDFKNEVINCGKLGEFQIVIQLNNQEISLFDNIVLSDYNTNNLNNVFGTSTKSASELLKNKYKPRQINYNIFNSTLSSVANDSNYVYTTVDYHDYTLSSSCSPNTIENLNQQDKKWWENWNNSSNEDCNVWFEATSNTNQLLNASSIIIACRTDNWPEARPTSITVKVYDQNNNEQIAYDGAFPNRRANFSIINFNQSYSFKKMRVEMNNNKFNAISLGLFAMSESTIVPFSNSFGFNNELMNFDANWNFNRNDDNNVSGLNNCYIYTNKPNASIEFTLNNSYGFNIIGQKNVALGDFNVYINDELYQNVTTNNTSRIDNDVLFSYHQPKTSLLKVKIVAKSSNLLRLNYITTFGANTSLI